MKNFAYVTTETLHAATKYLAESPDKRILVKHAGVDVVDRLKERLDEPDIVLNLRRARKPVNPIELRDDMVAISALTTVRKVGEHELTRKHFPALAAAAAHAATPQVRNVATVGGNLCQKPRCWYYRSQDYPCLKKGGAMCFAIPGDNRYHAIVGAGACHIVHPSNLAVPLMAYDAVAVAMHFDGKRNPHRQIPVGEFFRVPPNPQDDEHTLKPGELLREVRLYPRNGGERSGYSEIRHKQSFDWPLVTCAVNLNRSDAPRVVLGAVAPIPWRLDNVEQLIAGQRMSESLIEEARREATRGARPMTHNEYKVTLVGAALADALRQAAGMKPTNV